MRLIRSGVKKVRNISVGSAERETVGPVGLLNGSTVTSVNVFDHFLFSPSGNDPLSPLCEQWPPRRPLPLRPLLPLCLPLLPQVCLLQAGDALCEVSGDVISGEENLGEVMGVSGEGGGEWFEESSDASKVWEGDGCPKLSTRQVEVSTVYY